MTQQLLPSAAPPAIGRRLSLLRSVQQPTDTTTTTTAANTADAQPRATGDLKTVRAGPGTRRGRFAESAGRGAADCAALCCCCPCSLMNLLVLAVYKVPAGLCRRMRRKRQRISAGRRAARQQQKKKTGIFLGSNAAQGPAHRAHRPASDDLGLGAESDLEDSVADLLKDKKVEVSSVEDDTELEKEMWDQFHGAGFWRSPSQRCA